MNFLFFCESLFLEAFSFLVFGLLSFSFEIGGARSLYEWSFLLTYLTLLSIVIFRNLNLFKEKTSTLLDHLLV